MAIFVTVGAQMPFDRLIRTVDEWAAKRGRSDVCAQIGETDYQPSHIEWVQFLGPDEFHKHVESATVVVAHAGMGSILAALEAGKPILVMPRRGDLRETRNDHQVATAKRFLEMGKVGVAMNDNELRTKLDELDALAPADRIGRYASESLISAVRCFINS